MEACPTFSDIGFEKAGPRGAWRQLPIFLSPLAAFPNSIFAGWVVARPRVTAYLSCMANGLMPLAGLCALYLACAGCSSADEPDRASSAGESSGGGGRAPSQGSTGEAGSSTASGGGTGGSGASNSSGAAGASGGATHEGKSSEAPPAVDGRSIYALECHGDSGDCERATVPCFGVSSPAPNVAVGWACANRCRSDADCSDAPSGAEAYASCVPFTSASHCVLVCQNESQSFACPDGMSCYTPAKSPVGYCLWQ
jgi:hypothetical protein